MESETSPSTPTERPPTTLKLSKEVCYIRTVHPEGIRGVHLAILVFTHIVSLAPLWVRKHGMCFDNKFELFLVTALLTNMVIEMMRQSEPSAKTTDLVRVVLQAFSAVRLLDVNLCAFSDQTWKQP